MEDIIEVVDYDPAWPGAYASERDAVLGRLGPRIAAVEHIGSTAIVGLGAKPTIDLMVGASDLVVDDAVISGLAALDYRYLGEYGIAGRHFFRKGTPPTHHLHWVRRGGDFWWKQLVFRDYLRQAPEEARVYDALKHELAHRYHHDRARYTSSKGSFVTGILERAWRWRKAPLIVFDLEATCWPEGTSVERQETIEVGAVRVGPEGLPAGEFQRLVKPRDEPVLSGFCRDLTGIRQEEVDGAEPFPAVLDAFLSWGGPEPVRWASWSLYDLRQLKADCQRHNIQLPATVECHVDLRRQFADIQEKEPVTMKRALELTGMTLEGSHHRGIDDARNIARLAAIIMRG